MLTKDKLVNQILRNLTRIIRVIPESGVSGRIAKTLTREFSKMGKNARSIHASERMFHFFMSGQCLRRSQWGILALTNMIKLREEWVRLKWQAGQRKN